MISLTLQILATQNECTKSIWFYVGGVVYIGAPFTRELQFQIRFNTPAPKVIRQ